MDIFKAIKRTFTYTDKKGYLRLKANNKPIHRYIAAIKTGRPLKPGEVVHHKNRDKKDNSFDNLQVCKNQKEHDRIHKADSKKYGKRWSYKGF